MGKFHGSRDVKKEHYNLGCLLDEQKKREILEEAFLNRVGYRLNLDNPQTMNEKIMWLKLNYQDPLITKCADKYAVKDYVKDTIGEEYIVKTLGAWNSADEIDFDKLPNQFVLKVNWSSGYNIIVKDKSQLDIKQTREQIKKWMKPDRNAYYQYFNWGYKYMKPVVYAEEYLDQIDGQVYDYKFFFCNGSFEFMFIATDRKNDDQLTHDFFDSDFNLLPFTYGDRKHAKQLEKPQNYEKMIEMAKKLAEPFPFVRVDFYEIGDKIYLGEMTFYPGGGLLPFSPNEWDYKMGDKIKLPEKKIIDKESPFNPFLKFCKRSIICVQNALHNFRRTLIRKEWYKKQGYICILNLRIPYKIHTEIGEKYNKKYVSILGLEFCYRKVARNTQNNNTKVNTNTTFRYDENTPIEAFSMEDKITLDIQKIHCEQKAYKQLGYFPNLKDPRSFNEKIIWLALYYKNPHIAIAADKSLAKQWISERIGNEYVIPAIGAYTDVNDIAFSELPNQFVVKLNDGWGADKVMIVRDKSLLNIDRTKAVLSSWLYPWNNYYYKNMCITDEKMEKPVLLIEEYMEDDKTQELDDYKFYCCNGKPCFALVVKGRGTKQQTRTFVDADWNILPVERQGKSNADELEKPYCYDEMMRLAETLSKDFPLVRVDFYEINNKLYVGEMTFTPGMFLKFSSKIWDYKFGEYLDISSLVEEQNAI